MTRAVAGGCVLLALLDGYHHQFITFKEKGAPVDFVVPETMIKEPSGIWITKNTTRVLMRQLCLSIFFFPKPGQEVYQSGNRLVARKDMEWNFGGKKLQRTHVMDAAKWGRKYDELIKQFDQIFRRAK